MVQSVVEDAPSGTSVMYCEYPTLYLLIRGLERDLACGMDRKVWEDADRGCLRSRSSFSAAFSQASAIGG